MRILLALLALLAPLAAAAPAPRPAGGETRIALVIGNAAYKDSPLLNPVNDALAVGAALRSSGFEVIELHNQDAAGMRRAIREFGERLRGKGAGLFYFAGHGVQVRGRNFLVPVNADILYEDEIEDQSVDVSLVLGKMENAKARVNILVLDACRNNPFARTQRSGQNGLAPMEAPIGTLIAFATSPGQVASDGPGRNGLYTEQLVREIGESGLKVEDVFKRVRASVRVASKGRQIPWENTSLEGDFYFRYPEPVDTAAIELERKRREEAAIQRAVADALSRSKEEADREKQRLEKFYAQKLDAEREAIRKEALERIAAIESAAKAAAARPQVPIDMSTPPPAPMVVASAPPTVQVQPPRPVDSSQPIETSRPVESASPMDAARPAQGAAATTSSDPVQEPEDPKSGEIPASYLLALGVDPARRNRLLPVADDIARGLKPALPTQGDNWTYYREIRESAGLTRRNYLTVTVTFANDAGFTAQLSDAEDLARYDAQGNQLSAPSGRNQGPAVVFDPADALYRFPLAPGASFGAKHREVYATSKIDDSSEVTVVGWEQVKVPAGTFNAIKITKVANRSGEPFPGQTQQSKRVTNAWYVPALRNVARLERLEVTSQGQVLQDQTLELDSFELY